MDIYSIIDKRRTIRSFSDKKVEKETIFKVLSAGLKAPTYNHLREWDFMLINDSKTRMEIIEVENIPDKHDMEVLNKSFEGHDVLAIEMYLDAIPKQKAMILKAPELLVVVFKPKTKIIDSSSIYDLNCLASVWCCIENILLAMANEDLYGVTYIPQNTSRLKSILNIPQELEIATLIPFGYKPENINFVKQKNVSIEQKLHFNKW